MPTAPHDHGCYAPRAMEPVVDRSAWRLLPSERVLWHGRPTLGIPRDRRWTVIAGLFFAFAVCSALFGALLWVSAIPGHTNTLLVSCYLTIAGVGFLLAPRYLLDSCEFLVTDKRVLW